MEAGAEFRMYVKNRLEERYFLRSSQIRGCARLSGPLPHSCGCEDRERTAPRAPRRRTWRLGAAVSAVALVLPGLAVAGQAVAQVPAMVRLETQPQRQTKLPPRVAQARRFLAARGLVAGGAARIGASTPVGTASFTQARRVAPGKVRLAAGRVAATLSTTAVQNSSTATWQPLGPTAVLTPQFGLVTGRISSLALDPADSSGNHLYVGTTGGGVWQAQNAGSSTTSSIVFTPLTDSLAALGGAPG